MIRTPRPCSCPSNRPGGTRENVAGVALPAPVAKDALLAALAGQTAPSEGLTLHLVDLDAWYRFGFGDQMAGITRTSAPCFVRFRQLPPGHLVKPPSQSGQSSPGPTSG